MQKTYLLISTADSSTDAQWGTKHDSIELQEVFETAAHSHCRRRCETKAQWNLATRSWRATEGAPSCVLTGMKNSLLFIQPEIEVYQKVHQSRGSHRHQHNKARHSMIRKTLGGTGRDSTSGCALKAKIQRKWLCWEHAGSGWLRSIAGSIQGAAARTAGGPAGRVSMEDDERRGAVVRHVGRCRSQEPPLHRIFTAASKPTRVGNWNIR